MNDKINTLLPAKIDKNDPAYSSVLELDKVLDCTVEKGIRNIALTGPFGSGKSSVLKTLMTDFSTKHEYLPISLATLKANDEADAGTSQDNNGDSSSDDVETALNRRIEYSILQQLVYREETANVPNSRFKRISYIPPKTIRRYSVYGVLTLLAILIAFEPKFARIESFYSFFNLGRAGNLIADGLCVVWLLFILFSLFRYFFRAYANSKLNKLNLKDAEISVVEDNSIFNKHLDEILYFFQVTKYDVVIIEDLDRFDTTDIFLKLRELNQLINESKIVGRHISFIYAIKDDMFKNEERTKFFDHIVTVIPVINPSNSKDILLRKLKANGFENDGISDDDLSEMAFFIQDMRILTNIVNEYSQYREQLCHNNGNQKLDKTKLLAMIVYKNYFPKDFAELHCRKGKVYACISNKRKFIELASSELDKRNAEIQNEEKEWQKICELKEVDLRCLYLFNLDRKLPYKVASITMKSGSYGLEQIACNKQLFEELISLNSIQYSHISPYYGSGSSTANVDFKSIDADTHYSERLKRLKEGRKIYIQKYNEINRQKIAIRSLPLKVLLTEYQVGATEMYKNIGLAPMQDVFIRRGLIDEEYYDYISYFYEGMMSATDRELLLSIKRDMSLPFDYHIDKIDNFVKDLKDYMFESDAILNIELLSFLAQNLKYKDPFEHIMMRIERAQMPLDFLVQYYEYGQGQKCVFAHIITWDAACFWQTIRACDLENKDILMEAFLKFCEELSEEQQLWLNANYKFLVEHYDGLSKERALSLAVNSTFENLIEDNDELLDSIIEKSGYAINAHNLTLIVNYLCSNGLTISEDTLNYTRATSTGNNNVIEHINENIKASLLCFTDAKKDESIDSILYILNCPDLDAERKEEYLTRQQNLLPNFDSITTPDMHKIAISTYLIDPKWENIMTYFNQTNRMTDELLEYISHYSSELASQLFPEDNVELEESIYAELFYSNRLNVEKYTALLSSFRNVFPITGGVRDLSKDCLVSLINNGKLPFEEEILAVIEGTDAFAEYLIYHSRSFVNSLPSRTYCFSPEQLITLLGTSRFSVADKCSIIETVDIAGCLESSTCADSITELYSKAALNGDKLALSRISIDKRIQIVMQSIQMHLDNTEHIDILLKSLDDAYAELTENKRPLIENNSLNTDLLSTLKAAQYISSYYEDSRSSDKYRVIPRKR